MEYIQGKVEFSQEKDSVITLGKFDGVHIGHQKLIHCMKKAKGDCESIVFTFDVPPIPGKTGQEVLSTNPERAALIRSLGVDKLIECPFVPEISGMDAKTFLKEILVGQLRAKKIFVGPDFHFGHKRSGDVALLKACQETYGYTLTVVEKACFEGEEVSSTAIRSRIREGRLTEAKEMLGRPLFYTGEVAYGNQLGRTIGFPTANILVPSEKVVPPFGVYAVTLQVENRVFHGVANIGKKPTIQAKDGLENPIGIETYLFDFNEDIYGERVKVELHEFIRPERTFDSVEALKEEIRKNELQAREYFARRK